MTEQLPQVSKLAGALVEHQRFFESLSTAERQWVISNPRLAIEEFNRAVRLHLQPVQVVTEESPLLVRFGEVIRVDGVDEFVVADKYREGHTIDGVRFRWFGKNFKTHALPCVEKNILAGELVKDRLARNARDELCISARGGDPKLFAVSLCDWLNYLKTASKKGWHFGYIYIGEVLWAVSSYWRVGVRADGWRVGLDPVPGSGGWSEGAVLVSRNPLVA